MSKKNYLLLAAVAALVFGLSEYIEWYGDALLYRFSFATGEPVRSMTDVLSSQYTHYFTMNGRIWAHVLCQGFAAMWGQTAFAVCNAVVYIAFVWLFARVCEGTESIYNRQLEMNNLSDGRKRQADGYTFGYMLMCVLAVLTITDTSYIPTCQVGYVWTATATLGFILMYFRCRSGHRPGPTETAGLFILALLAGNGNEAIAIGTGAALIVDVGRSVWLSRQEDRRMKRTHRRGGAENTAGKYFGLTAAQWVMVAGFGIGGLLLCLSPGILRRASGDSANAMWSVYRLLGYSRMLYVLVFTLIVLRIRHMIRLREFVNENVFYITALLALSGFNLAIGIGELSGRQLFGVELFSGILTVRALRGVRVRKWIIVVAAMAVAGLYALKVDYLHKSNDDLRTLRSEMATSKDLKIYMDFHRYSPLVHPSELWNNYQLYAFMAAAIYDDMDDYGHYYYNFKTLVSDPPYFESLAIYPTVMKEVLAADDKNFAVKGADGLYLVVQDQVRPRCFFLDREYNLFGIRRPREPYEVEFSNAYHMDMDGVRVVYSDFSTPMVDNLCVRY